MRRIMNRELPKFKLRGYVPGKKEEFLDFKNKDIKGKWSVFFFYPADFTFVCPTELEDLANYYEELKKIDVHVFSVSTDSVFSHKAWHDSSKKIGKIKFPMLADPVGSFTKKLGVYRDNEGVSDRATFVIDPEGVIKIVEITDEGIGRNASELLRKIKAAQFIFENKTEVCPANWNSGDKTLTPSIDLVGDL